ncbi:olfactory receptor 52K1-like [Nothobranchius furzeri]|uniref:Olfactory receptor 52K1-like n=1 Tax=Nothobranchius furzeri TaxID=105023 RepID=A0A9D2YCR0_NOTFU|nr:olfactory receptor 52K1-like [Nothobranchius furzeri]KAF7218386.1 olfactory receptor 52K1-like [Nothobranchius furzeri]
MCWMITGEWEPPHQHTASEKMTFHVVLSCQVGSGAQEEERMEPLKENISSHTFFIFSGFTELGALRPLFFAPLLVLFVVSLFANTLLLHVIISRRSLHSPMYILIGGMAGVDLIQPMLVLPTLMLSIVSDQRGVSLSGCLVQMYFVQLLGTCQSTLLLWMALDRYFAICTPLYYHERMSVRRFLKFVVLFLVRNVFLVSVVVSLAGRLSFCSSHVINHCFCEHMALVELACGSTSINSLVGLVAVFLVTVFDFFIVISYMLIFHSALRSGKSGAKALHTCTTHIIVMVVGLTFVLTAFLSYRLGNRLPGAGRVSVSIMYLFLPSCFNPIIYGVRTTEIRQHILKMLSSSRPV